MDSILEVVGFMILWWFGPIVTSIILILPVTWWEKRTAEKNERLRQMIREEMK